MQGNDRPSLAYGRTINLKILLSPFYFLFLLQYKEHKRKLHAETFAKLETKTRQKKTSVPSKTDDPHFLISEGDDVEVDNRKKDGV